MLGYKANKSRGSACETSKPLTFQMFGLQIPEAMESKVNGNWKKKISGGTEAETHQPRKQGLSCGWPFESPFPMFPLKLAAILTVVGRGKSFPKNSILLQADPVVIAKYF